MAQIGTAVAGALLSSVVACGGEVGNPPPVGATAGIGGVGSSGGTAHDDGRDASTGVSGAGGGSLGGGGNVGSGSATDAAPDGSGLDRCQSCQRQGSDLSLSRRRDGPFSNSPVDPNQFVSSEIRRDPTGELVLSGRFYLGCGGCGGVDSDDTIAIPPTILSPESEMKLAELTSGLVPQPCRPQAPNCHPVHRTVTIGGCEYWYREDCENDRREGERVNEARLQAVMAYIDGLGLATLGTGDAG
jgi:hypothetical protein